MSIAVQIGLERMVSIELMGWRMHLGVSLGQWVAWCNSLLCHLCVGWDGCRIYLSAQVSRRRTMYRPCFEQKSSSSSAQSSEPCHPCTPLLSIWPPLYYQLVPLGSRYDAADVAALLGYPCIDSY